MDIKVYPIGEISNKQIGELIEAKNSFELTDVEHMNKSVLTIEAMIEEKGLKCRVYTKGRVAAVGAAAIPVSPTVIGGWLAGIGIGIHNLATFNPDYEIAKNPIGSTLSVNYKK